MKIDWDSVYKDRLEEIDKQINIAVHEKHWGFVKILKAEQKEIKKKLEG